MTEFEKLVTETPITVDCFEKPSFSYDDFSEENLLAQDTIEDLLIMWNIHLIPLLETLRKRYIQEKDEKYLKELIRLLPNTYRVRKDNVQYEFREVKHHKMI